MITSFALAALCAASAIGSIAHRLPCQSLGLGQLTNLDVKQREKRGRERKPAQDGAPACELNLAASGLQRRLVVSQIFGRTRCGMDLLASRGTARDGERLGFVPGRDPLADQLLGACLVPPIVDYAPCGSR